MQDFCFVDMRHFYADIQLTYVDIDKDFDLRNLYVDMQLFYVYMQHVHVT